MSPPARVSIIGCCGSGKTTLAKELAVHWHLERIELDEIRHLPHWTERTNEEFIEILSEKVKAPRYVIDGNYGFSRHVYWEQLDLVILLDYPFWTVFRQLLRRTIRRSARRELLWAGNRESFVKSFMSRDSILIWFLKTHRRRHLAALEIEKNPPHAGCAILRFLSPQETRTWLLSQENLSST